MQYRYGNLTLDESQIEIYDSFFAYRVDGQCKQGNLSELIRIDSQPIANSTGIVVPMKQEEKEAETEQVNINACTPAQLAKAVRGIGKSFATKVIVRKPDGGYKSWEQLGEVNADLPLNWKEIEEDSKEVIIF
jgi:hypothetical protein